MKTILTSIFLVLSIALTAQSLAIVSADVRNMTTVSNDLVIDMIRLELEEHSTYPVMDRYEVADKIQAGNIQVENCLSTTCLSRVAEQIGAKKMVTATIEKLGDRIYYTIRIVDASKSENEKTEVLSFIPKPELIREFTAIMVKKLFNVTQTTESIRPYTIDNDYASKINLPEKDYIKANGPRMGVSMHFGSPNAAILAKPRNQGGFDIQIPAFYQFGYQFEKQYLTAGSFQALVECLVLLNGVEQGMFNPTMTIMNGFRSSANGLEFAFGPTFGITRKAQGYEDESGNFILSDNDDFDLRTQLDSRGDAALSAGFVFAFGKTIRTGNLNIPINAYFTTNNESYSYGLSIGFNSQHFR